MVFNMTQKQSTLNVLVLAAGKGTRMHSSLPKVLHPIGGLPLVSHSINAAKEIQKDTNIAVLISKDFRDVETYLSKQHPEIKTVYQSNALGTGHGVKEALSQWAIEGNLIVTFGDTPLVNTQALQTLQDTLNDNDLVIAAMQLDDAAQYGRICTDAQGRITKIVEFKNATPAEKQITLANAGFMGMRLETVAPLLEKLTPNATTGEYYLTDLVELANAAGLSIAVASLDPEICMGVNDRRDLAFLENAFQQRKRQEFMTKGVTLLDPTSVYFSYDTSIDSDVTIEPQVFFGTNVHIAQGAHIKAFSHIEGATIGQNAVVGPFARLRPGTNLGENSKVGNFVELKNTTLGVNSKVNHLSYLGDASLGTDVNVGAGTITCNYDGHNKWQTTIGDGVFIGSNTALIAPLTIGANAMIGAGSTLTHDVAEGSLSLTRAPLKEIENGAQKVHRQNEAKKKAKVKESPTCAA